MTITAKESTFEEMTEGVYTGIFRGWEDAGASQYGPGVKLIWALPDLLDKDNAPREKWQFASQTLTPRTKLWGICKALGAEPVLGSDYELDELLDPLVGAQATLVVTHDDAGKAKITNVLPMAQNARPVSPSPKA